MKTISLLFTFVAFLFANPLLAQNDSDVTIIKNKFLSSIDSNSKIPAIQKEDVSNFIKSAQFEKFIKTPLFMELDLANCILDRVGQFGTSPNLANKIIDIDFIKNKKLIGTISYIKYKAFFELQDYPTDNYLIQLGDCRNYDTTSNQGDIFTYDITAKPHQILVSNFTKNETILNDIPLDEQTKNELILLFPKNSKSTTTSQYKAHHCDLNGNGNVTFGECFTCMRNACRSNPECWHLCTWSIPAINQCNASTTIACGILSIMY